MPTEFTLHTFVIMKYVVTVLVFLGAYWGIKRMVRLANNS